VYEQYRGNLNGPTESIKQASNQKIQPIAVFVDLSSKDTDRQTDRPTDRTKTVENYAHRKKERSSGKNPNDYS
jgi:hypothetical protein